jgi:hypothetical protein
MLSFGPAAWMFVAMMSETAPEGRNRTSPSTTTFWVNQQSWQRLPGG